jgi:RNA polymerase sigma factor (TIGR02999 family)
MRRILIEQARRKQRERHGGGLKRVELPEYVVAPAGDDQILLLDEALTRLAGIRSQAAKLVQLRFFAGPSTDEAAPVVGVSSRTARRLWVFAQAWLRREMESLAGGK